MSYMIWGNYEITTTSADYKIDNWKTRQPQHKYTRSYMKRKKKLLIGCLLVLFDTEPESNWSEFHLRIDATLYACSNVHASMCELGGLGKERMLSRVLSYSMNIV